MKLHNKERLDLALTNKGLCDSREKAKTTIMAGLVYVDGSRIDKPGTKVSLDSNIEIKGDPIGFVSRGGLKLDKALKVFDVLIMDKVCADVGASTGGFTDCLLKNGASRVYSIDVGYGQLAWKLRNDKRVVPMERTNFRNVTLEKLGEAVDIVTVDTSFISVTKFIGNINDILKGGGDLIILIKPQFEAGISQVGKKGVVRDPQVHKGVIHHIIEAFSKKSFIFLGLTYSPIKGPMGNIEYLAWLKRDGSSGEIVDYVEVCNIIEDTIGHAHAQLN